MCKPLKIHSKWEKMWPLHGASCFPYTQFPDTWIAVNDCANDSVVCIYIWKGCHGERCTKLCKQYMCAIRCQSVHFLVASRKKHKTSFMKSAFFGIIVALFQHPNMSNLRWQLCRQRGHVGDVNASLEEKASCSVIESQHDKTIELLTGNRLKMQSFSYFIAVEIWTKYDIPSK